MSRIFYLCPDSQTPHGGNRVLYRHIDILRTGGLEAWAVHQKPGFKYEWFQNCTPRLSLAEVAPSGADVLVLPETIGAIGRGLHPEIRRVVFNQNAYNTFAEGWNLDGIKALYTQPTTIGVLAISQNNSRYLKFAFPGLRVYRVPNSVDARLFFPREKRARIVCMPRKGQEDLVQLKGILTLRGSLKGVEWLEVDGETESKVAELIGSAAVFVSTGHWEGCPMPPLEAMASACWVVGYHGQGGKEYFRNRFCTPVDSGDIISLSQGIERALEVFRNNRSAFDAHTEQARNYICDHYSVESERRAVIRFWRGILKPRTRHSQKDLELRNAKRPSTVGQGCREERPITQ